MKKLLFFAAAALMLSCNSDDDNKKNTEPVNSSYNITVTTTCPSPGTSGDRTYCVNKSEYDDAIEAIDRQNNGCVKIFFNTLDGESENGYIKSAGIGCE